MSLELNDEERAALGVVEDLDHVSYSLQPVGGTCDGDAIADGSLRDLGSRYEDAQFVFPKGAFDAPGSRLGHPSNLDQRPRVEEHDHTGDVADAIQARIGAPS